MEKIKFNQVFIIYFWFKVKGLFFVRFFRLF